ncbi:DUF6585 family protein [Streptomyces halobius]|uniref:Uncharacterized protein n=1 Tax=Streptomyces halobius TaxID=2879846 RepID=A0ABY4M2I5_9ACTN|nr:DUF6585 family protein [Streptomyces halobius]UQA91974.1 hypothetical protein K9S39_09030 [Streptomyces halobius]
MTPPTPPTRGEELLLARISAAAGREHLGKRCATYGGAAHPAHAHAVPVRGIRALLAFVRYGRPSATKASADARVDLYEHGMTVAVNGRIHVVRYDTTSVFQYDTTSVFQNSTRHPHGSARIGTTRTYTTYTLTDVEGKRVVLHGVPENSDAEEAEESEEWGHEIQRAVARAQVPRALAALDKGERLTFGDIWLTREKVGSGEVSARWQQVRRCEIEKGAISLDIDGNWHGMGPTVSRIPNLLVFCALVERLRTDAARS